MADHPILFSGPMIRAILDGRKSQTRRVVKPTLIGGDCAALDNSSPPQWWTWIGSDESAEPWDRLPRCPYGQPGDKLWVRETWAPADLLAEGYVLDDPVCVGYRADLSAVSHEAGNVHSVDTYAWNWDRLRWRPSIHMPRWASRLSLLLTGVRVERLHAISEEDARGEGAGYGVSALCGFPPDFADRTDGVGSYRDCFRHLWDSINGARPGCSWADNPWVWAISFAPEAPHV